MRMEQLVQSAACAHAIEDEPIVRRRATLMWFCRRCTRCLLDAVCMIVCRMMDTRFADADGAAVVALLM